MFQILGPVFCFKFFIILILLCYNGSCNGSCTVVNLFYNIF